jgi:hypothetical protein
MLRFGVIKNSFTNVLAIAALNLRVACAEAGIINRYDLGT